MKAFSEEQILDNLRQQDDTSAQYYAAWWLGKMRSQHRDAIPLLIHTLSALNKQPVDPDRRGVALNSIRALGLLRDASASGDLIRLLQSDDHSVREEAARSLGSMKDPGAIKPICQLLSGGIDKAGREQKGTALLREPCEALIEALGEIGDDSAMIQDTILPFCQHPRPLVRAAACRSLLQLTGCSQWAEELKTLLEHPEPLVRRGALLDLGATGWTAALPAIKTAAVEASLKLVALRGLAECSDDTAVLDAMDDLL